MKGTLKAFSPKTKGLLIVNEEGEKWHTASQAVIGFASKVKGQEVELTLEEGTVTKITPLGQGRLGSQTSTVAPQSSEMSKDDWAMKEKRDHRRRIMLSLLANHPDKPVGKLQHVAEEVLMYVYNGFVGDEGLHVEEEKFE
jgi:hypothetical protein